MNASPTPADTASDSTADKTATGGGYGALDRWRLASGATFDELGVMLGVSRVTAFRLCRKGTIPSREVMARIVAVTGGEVTADAMFEPVGRGT